MCVCTGCGCVQMFGVDGVFLCARGLCLCMVCVHGVCVFAKCVCIIHGVIVCVQGCVCVHACVHAYVVLVCTYHGRDQVKV